MTSEVTTIDEAREQKRGAALLKAIGLDRVPPEQREIALAIAKRYELDLLLKHLVLVDGRPYVTRDGLLHVAHRSGQLDGIEVTDPELVKLEGQGDFWRAKASVYRKDMSRPFVYQGRYPARGGNQRFAPEMAVKVAEVMALRRAFDVSAPVIEERWDIDVPERGPEPTITEQIAAKRAALSTDQGSLGHAEVVVEPLGHSEALPGQDGDQPGESSPSRRNTRPATPAGARTVTQARSEPASTEAGKPMPASAERCRAFEPSHGRCLKDEGHRGPHAGGDGETWN